MLGVRNSLLAYFIYAYLGEEAAAKLKSPAGLNRHLADHLLAEP
jgi:hypothetical protein